MAQRRPPSAPSSEPGPRISRNVIFVATSLAQGRPILRLSMDNLQTPLHESCPPSRWDAWENPMKLLKPRFFWRPMTLVSSRVSNCSWLAAEGKSDRETLHRRSCLVAFRRDASEDLPPSSRFRAKV